jgi:hypothetical protein
MELLLVVVMMVLVLVLVLVVLMVSVRDHWRRCSVVWSTWRKVIGFIQGWCLLKYDKYPIIILITCQ